MSKNSKSDNAKENKPKPFSLAGWVFLVMEGPIVRARGHIAHSPQQGAFHLIQFGDANTGGAFFRMLSNESLQQGSLHPSHAECEKFIATVHKQLSPGGKSDKEELDPAAQALAEGIETLAPAPTPDITPRARARDFIGRKNVPEKESEDIAKDA